MTWYEVLQISRHATPDEIKRAYRRLTLVRHPDAGGSTEAMRELLEAYRILSDPRLRQDYDRKLGPEKPSDQDNAFHEDATDSSAIPPIILGSPPPVIHRNQRVLARSNGKTVAQSRCAVGIHSVIAIPPESCVVVLAVIRNLSAQIQPVGARDTVLLDQFGLQSSGESAWRILENNGLSALWSSDVEVRPKAMTRLGMYYPWDGFGAPRRWVARWSFFEPGYTSGLVKGYIDIDVPLKELTQ